MRELKLFIAASLDGFIARSDGGIDWLFSDADYGYAAFYDSIDVVIQGRKTYDLARSFPEYPYPGKECLVFSRSRAGNRDGHAHFVAGDVCAVLADLRRTPGKHLWLVGGGELTADFRKHGLIDEYIISIHPIILGSGLPLFLPQEMEEKLALIGCERFPSGLVQLTYRRNPPP